jgi:hypothetical protein
MLIPVRPPRPDDPPPPGLGRLLTMVGVFFVMLMTITGTALFLGGHPIF